MEEGAVSFLRNILNIFKSQKAVSEAEEMEHQRWHEYYGTECVGKECAHLQAEE